MRGKPRPVNDARVLVSLIAIALSLAGCVGQATPDVTVTPEDARTVDPASVQVPVGIDPLAEDPVEPAPPAPEFEGPTAEEVDDVLRATFGSDPIGLVQDPDAVDRLPLEVNDRVDAWINYFQNVIPERFGLYLERAGRYEPMIRRKLRERGMPQDLLYLALIESGMNPNAYSRAAAVGMWQFISSTGRMYDLEVSTFVDERRDPEKATDAALRFLSDLHARFGSWYLAAAAYNGGPGRISRGLARTNGGTFWDLADSRLLRSETRDYVPKLIAAAIIGHHPERYGFENLARHEPLDLETVVVPDATSFDVLAEAIGTDEETLRELNPHLPQKMTPPNRAVTLHVPAGLAEGFETKYAAIPPEDRITWTYHVVRSGQTLGGIGRDYGVSVAQLREANGNVDPRRLRIGQQLLIPKPGRIASTAGSSRTAAGGTQTRAPSQPGVETQTVVVRRGDSLWTIARRHSVSTRDLMEWNNLASSVIHPGTRLRVRR